jgi:hypothetical protein
MLIFVHFKSGTEQVAGGAGGTQSGTGNAGAAGSVGNLISLPYI